MSKRWFWAWPIAVTAALATGNAVAQALPVAEMNPTDTTAALQPAAAASATTFSQLSRPATRHTDEAQPAEENSREGLWLPLAGAAALAFVARRNRRAFDHTPPHPQTKSA